MVGAAGGAAGRERFDALDSLRGLCACAVAVGHVSSDGALSDIFRNVALCVDFFFVLSGFVIAASYGAALRGGFPVGRFMALRLGRLLPLHVAVLLGFLAIELGMLLLQIPSASGRAPFDGLRSAETLPLFLLLVQIFVPDAVPHWNGPSWSIAAEMWVYLFAALGLSLLRDRFRWVLAAAIPLCIVLLALLAGRLTEVTFLSPLRCLLGFAIGMLCFDLHRLLRARLAGASTGALSAAEWTLGVAAAAGIFLLGEGAGAFAMPFVFAALILFVAQHRGTLSRGLLAAPLRWLGKVSYSIYMVHMLVLTVFMKLLAALPPTAALVADSAAAAQAGGPRLTGGAAADLITVAFLLLVLAASAISYRLVEAPFRAASRRWVERRGAVRVREAERVAPTM